MAESGTATTTAMWDTFLPCIEWSIKTTLSLYLNINTYLCIYPFLFLNWEVFNFIPPDPTGQLNILRHHCDVFYMYGAQLGRLK